MFPLVKRFFLSRFFRFILLPLLLLFLFRAPLYRACFSYRLLRARSEVQFSPANLSTPNDQTVKQVILASLDRTARLLSFTTRACPVDTISLRNGGKTNCIGYAALDAEFCNKTFSKDGFSQQVKAEPWVAQIYFFGFNIHRLFSDPAWKDHDIVVITDRKTGKHILLDPTLFDYSGIGFVTERK